MTYCGGIKSGDWGVVCASDARSSDLAVVNRTRILSAYELGTRRERLWIITEASRRATTLLLPSPDALEPVKRLTTLVSMYIYLALKGVELTKSSGKPYDRVCCR